MPRIILVGGGSSSGKSYLTSEAIKAVGEDKVTRISLDDYYKDQADIPLEERYLVNYDHPTAFDWKLLRKQLSALKNGESIEKPIYDFKILTRSQETETIVPKDLVVIEGIMALTDENVRKIGDLKIFVHASAERRLLRRMFRDKKERARSYENIVHQYFASVQPMYDEIVEPSSMYADLIINNDGVKNLSLEVLTCLFKDQLDLVHNPSKVKPSKMKEDFEVGSFDDLLD
ncbi:MAG: uridine kinase [Bacilli bacterium]|nr:uridine kinase [Bacilli bacterium]